MKIYYATTKTFEGEVLTTKCPFGKKGVLVGGIGCSHQSYYAHPEDKIRKTRCGFFKRSLIFRKGIVCIANKYMDVTT